MNNFLRSFLLLLASLPLLTSCGLVEEVSAIGAAKGTLSISYKGPKGANSSITVSGPGLTRSYSDDGSGFDTALQVRGGTFTLSAPRVTIEGKLYRSLISARGANGNQSSNTTNTVSVEDNKTSSFTVTYEEQPQ